MATIERLTRRPDFLAAAEGRRFHTERMTAQGRLRAEPPQGTAGPAGLRLGFTITKRVGCAPERNRIRRRLRAAVDRVAADLPPELAGLPADIVLVARRPALDAAFDALTDDLRRAIPTVTRPRAPGDGSRAKAGVEKAGVRKADARAHGRGEGRPGHPAASRSAEREAGSREESGAPRPDRPASAAPPNTCCGVPDGQ